MLPKNDSLSFNLSALYRLSMKYFDNLFSNHEIGYTQLLFLSDIYENEGISMNELVKHGNYDKGTVTKSLQKLLELGYIEIKTPDNDKRLRLLYTTTLSQQIMAGLLYEKQKWLNYLCLDLTSDERQVFFKALSFLTVRAKQLANKLEVETQINALHFYGLQKVSLASFSPFVSSILYVAGSNFRSPYALARNYLFLNENDKALTTQQVLTYLKQKRGLIDAITLRGGEPLLYEDAYSFIKTVKHLGYKIKIETNGTFFLTLKKLIDEKLVDYVSLEILNSQANYNLSAGSEVDYKSILASINYLLKGVVAYDFHTILVKDYQTISDLKDIAKLIKTAKRYYLDQYDENISNIGTNLKAFSNDEMATFLKAIINDVPNASLRLVKE